MAIFWFEGFETCGTLVGAANATATRAEIAKRVTTMFSGGPFLIDDPDIDGFAVNFGGNFQSAFDLTFDGSTLGNERLGHDGSIITVGANIHFPSPARNFSLIRMYSQSNAGNDNFLDLGMRADGGLAIARGASVRMETGPLTPSITGEWAYVEFSYRNSGMAGTYATAKVAAIPADGATILEIDTLEERRPFWRAGTSYSTGTERSWMGRVYEMVAGPNSTGDIPDENPLIWEDVGSMNDPSFLEVFDSSFQPHFHILQDPERRMRNTLGIDNNPADQIRLSGNSYDIVGGDYQPAIGDDIVVGDSSFVEVRLNGVRIMVAHLRPNGSRFNDLGSASGDVTGHTLDRTTFIQTFGITGTGENFVGFDDVYISSSSQMWNPDTRGVSLIRSLPPTSDIVSDWTAVPGPDNFSGVDENGNDAADYVDAASNTLVDRYGCTDFTEFSDGQIHAVRVEAEVINTTMGSPVIEVSVGPSGEISETFIVDNIVASEVVQVDTEIKPGGGFWGFPDIDDLQVGIESSGL